MATVGEKAPGFTLPSDSWEPGGLARGGAAGVASGLFFYPGDWSLEKAL
jgi:peroxiredoxin